MRLSILIAVVLLLLSPSPGAAQPTLDYVIPVIANAGTGDVISLVGSNFGAAGDSVLFPGSKMVPVIASGAGWVNVVVPQTWSGDVQVWSSASETLSNAVPLEIRYRWLGSKWAAGGLPLTWWLNDQGAPGCTLTETYNELQNGYWEWECASDVSTSFLGYTQNQGLDQFDGQNVLWWKSFDTSPTVLAATRITSLSGDIQEFDIAFNSEYFTWSCSYSATDINVRDLAVHEQGHSIGLGDMYGDPDNHKSMYGWSGPGVIFHATVALEDVLGAEFMYPRAGRPNMTSNMPVGWYGPITPRNTNDATDSYAPLPPTLNGNTGTYLNFAGRNGGLDCAATESRNDIFIDEAFPFGLTWFDYKWIQGDTRVIAANISKTVPGGRHTIRIEYDSTDLILESNESDNIYAQQFVYSPYVLANLLAVDRPKPPVYGNYPAPNCDGFEFTGGWWGAVGMLHESMDDDYDLYLFDDYSGSLSGFSNIQSISQSLNGETEFVLVNGNQLGQNPTAYVGAVEWDGTGGIAIQQSNELGTTTAPTAYGDETSVGGFVINSHDALHVHEFYLPDPNVTYRFTLDNLSGTADLDMGIFPADGIYMSKFDLLTGSLNTEDGGDEEFLYSPPFTGYYAVVVWKKNATGYGRANSYELKVASAPSNLNAGSTPPGWELPVVPRSSTGATMGSVSLTATLPGNANSTYFNWAIDQEGPNAMPGWDRRLYLDDSIILNNSSVAADNPPDIYAMINYGPFVVRGGRHTLTEYADFSGLVAETNETDNTYSRQFVWSPLVETKNVPDIRTVPPAPGTGILPNCAGFEFTPGAATSWVVGIVSQDPADDYDLYVYDDYSGSSSGFSSELAMSGFAGNSVDFAVGSSPASPVPVYPGAVRSAVYGGSSLIVDQSDALGREGGEFATFPLQILDPDRLVDVYRASLTAGVFYQLEVSITSGPADLSLAVMPSTPAGSFGRSDALGESTLLPSGREMLGFTAPYTGTYPIVVFRREGATTNPVIKYTLHWGPSSVTGVPGEGAVPREFAFLGARPNPVRSSSVLEFTLPRESEVRVEMFNIQGRRVAALAEGRFSAGRHALPWNGRDEAGRSLASGVYYLRLESRDGSETRRITVLR